MNKRKIVLLASALLMVAVLAVGGTLAYFQDDESITNVFTVGYVEIDLDENFEQGSELMPSTGKDEDGNVKNAVEKEVFVTNTGANDAYVRVHIAIPDILDNGNPSFDAGENVLHFNYSPDSVGADKWDWSNSTGAPYEGTYNYYETQIAGIDYNVYVVTYEKALVKDEVTVNAIHQVYLDSRVTNQDIIDINEVLEADNWQILVVAEGVQAEGFANAYEALNTAFGIPGTYEITWPYEPAEGGQ
ncbi:MAG: hypothetical protein E7318_03355 [Clostridiales bacterium]|nr:hypothetical protein [Clostridiales bacterium]